MNNDSEINLEEAYQATYDRLKIGDRVQISVGVTFQKGTVIDKHLFRIVGEGTYNQVFMDVLLDNGDIVERFRCYTLFYPRFDWLDNPSFTHL